MYRKVVSGLNAGSFRGSLFFPVIITGFILIALIVSGCTSGSTPTPSLGAVPPVNSEDTIWCTSVLGYGTSIQTEGGYQTIEKIQVGDRVMIAGADLKWEARAIKFSDGQPANQLQTMIALQFKLNNTETSLIVTRDTTFLTPSRKFVINADRLKVGDLLLAANGDSVTVENVTLGSFKVGFQAISTESSSYLNAAGLVVTEYGFGNGLVETEQSLDMN